MKPSAEYPTHKVRTISCARCGETATGRMPPKRKYCSWECSSKTPTRQRTGKYLPCEQCGIVKYFRKYRIDIAKNLFCSRKCANTWQGRNKVEKTCIVCGEVFKLSPSWETFSAGLYCSLKCRDKSPLQKKHLIEMNVKQQRQKKPNKLEAWGISLLQEWNVPFVPQALIGDKFLVDVLIPVFGIIIQWDGDYWHGYREPGDMRPLDRRQQKRVALDISQDAYLRKCGYTVLRYWEHEVHKKTSGVICDLQIEFQRAKRRWI